MPSELHECKMGELQGGQKVRVLLAQALFGNPAAAGRIEILKNLDAVKFSFGAGRAGNCARQKIRPSLSVKL